MRVPAIRLAGLGVAVIVGCSPRAPNVPAPPPQRVVATFAGEVDAERGTVRFWSDDGTAMPGATLDPRALGRALKQIPVSQDGVAGTGAPDTVELVTEAAGVVPGGCGGMDGYEGVIRVRSFFASRYLENASVEITSLTPSGREACNSAFGGPGLSSSNGLFAYGTLAPAGAAGDSVAVPWRFRLPDRSRFTFQGRVLADPVAPCSGDAWFPGAPLMFGAAYARQMATSDLDADGYPDFIFLHQAGADVVWGDGNAGASNQWTLSSGFVQDVAIGDVDGDGRPDVVFAIGTSIVVRRNTGARTFAAAVSIPVAASGSLLGLALGDLNSDGKLDVAAIHNGNVSGPYTVYTLLNASSGPGSVAFTGVSARSVPDQAYEVAIADWNGDGRRDVAVAIVYSLFARGVSLYLGAGDGSILTATTYDTPGDAFAVAGVDLDGDGKTDLVTLGRTDVVVLLNQGAGPYPAAPAFAAPARYAMAGNAGQLVVGDLDGDGRPDVATAVTTAHKVAVFLNQGAGALAPAVGRRVGPSPWGLVMADLDRDGTIDLAAVDNADGYLYPVLNAGGATFPAFAEYATGPSPVGVAAGDLDGDGDPDLALSTFTYGGVDLKRNQGDGTFAAWTTLPTAAGIGPIAIADLSGDGRNDIAVLGSQAAVILARSDGTFAPAVSYAVGSSPQGIAAGDLDGDGDLDLAVATATGRRVDILLGQGGGTFASGTPLATSAPAYGVAIADVNRDGIADVVARLVDVVAVFIGRADHTFAPQVSYAAPGSAHLAVADLDEDGWPDVVVAGGGSISGLGVLLSAGNGTFLPVATYGYVNNPYDLVLADLDGDGKVDAAVTELAGNQGTNVHVFRGDGTGVFAFEQMHPTAKGPRGIVAIDFDGDDRIDLAVANSAANTLSVLPNRCWPTP